MNGQTMSLNGQQLGTPFPAVNPERMPAIIPVKFEEKFKPDPADSTKFIAEDWVEWVKKGEAGGATTREAIKRLRPSPKNPQGAVEWPAIAPAYQAWKAGNETPITGTPLHAWPGVSREMAEALKKYNIFTVEDLAEMPDHTIPKIPLPLVRELRLRARAHREVSAASDVAGRLASRDAKIEQLEADNGEMAEALSAMQARLAALEKGALPASGQAPAEDPGREMQRHFGATPVSGGFEMDPDAPVAAAPAEIDAKAHRGGWPKGAKRGPDGKPYFPEG